MRLLLVFLLFLSGAISRATANPGQAWNEAMTAYKAGDIDKALEGFMKIAEDEKQLSAALCHNIANCEYRLGESAEGSSLQQRKDSLAHFALASVWYRRALALDPWLAEAQQNLRFLRTKKLGYHWFAPSGLAKFGSRFPRWKWLAACQASIWAAVIMIVWLVWLTPRPGRRWPLVTLLSVAVALVIVTLCGLTGKALDRAPFTKRVIAMETPESFARSAPAEAAGTVISLPPGSELLPVREEGFWTYCEIPGGDKDSPLRGWVRTSTTRPLWPWSASLAE